MSHPLTKYIAASAVAGAIAFGGFTLAGAQEGTGSTTTTETPAQTAPDSGTSPTPPQGERPDGEHCHGRDGGGTDGSSSEAPAPQTTPSTGSESSNTTNT